MSHDGRWKICELLEHTSKSRPSARMLRKSSTSLKYLAHARRFANSVPTVARKSLHRALNYLRNSSLLSLLHMSRAPHPESTQKVMLWLTAKPPKRVSTARSVSSSSASS